MVFYLLFHDLVLLNKGNKTVFIMVTERNFPAFHRDKALVNKIDLVKGNDKGAVNPDKIMEWKSLLNGLHTHLGKQRLVATVNFNIILQAFNI